MKERGLFYANGEYKSRNQIRRKLASEGILPDLQFITPVALPLDVTDYIRVAQQRADSSHELSAKSENYMEVELPRTSIINVLGDLHLGHPNTHYDRLAREIEVIRSTADSYVIFAGDLVDGIFWGGESGAEQVMSISEQHNFMRSIFHALKGKIIMASSGEHDSKWASKTGYDPYDMMSGITGAPYIRGIAEIMMFVGDQQYKVVSQHKARGHSMYNKNHSTYREARFSLQDADVYIAGHTHQKQVSQEAIRKFHRSEIVTHISIGAYKDNDSYGQREGFPEMYPQQMYGASFLLDANAHHVEVNYDIIEGHNQWVE